MNVISICNVYNGNQKLFIASYNINSYMYNTGEKCV